MKRKIRKALKELDYFFDVMYSPEATEIDKTVCYELALISAEDILEFVNDCFTHGFISRKFRNEIHCKIHDLFNT